MINLEAEQHRKWWPLALSFVLGAGSAFAFAPVGLWPLMLIAFAVLLGAVIHVPTLRRAVAVGYVFGLGQFVIGLNWIATAFTYQAAMPAWLGWIAVVLLSIYLAVYPALATGVAWRIGKGRPVALALSLAGSWAVTEWLRAGIFTGFAWNPVGVTLVPTPLREVAPLVGTYGLSALVVLLSAALWLAFQRKWPPALAIAAATLILWVLPSSNVPNSTLALRPIRVVQPNIGQQDKWRPGFSEVAAQRLAQLSMQQSGARPRLLFWPEAAVTNPLEDYRTEPYNAFAAFERQRAAAIIGPGEYVLTGGIALFSRDGRNLSGAANSVFVLGPGGQVAGRYDKAHLVPYGEYLPMRPLLSAIGLSRLAPGDVDFADGPGPRTLALPNWGKVGFQLCYEIIFSGEVVDRRNRPDFIFNPSNDAWFGSWGPPQHLAQARLRATEEGLPVVRSTPTGISAVVDGRGRVVASIPAHKAAVIDTLLPPPSQSLTPFARFGNVIPLLIGFGLILAGIALARGGRYRQRT